MTAGRQRNMAPQPDVDIRLIIQEAQNRWLRPAEVCEILRNYKQHNFKLNPVPPTTPQSGSLFLFDRKALRYFRKDGHNWRKKKDGKTVREAHERLKAGSVDVLHCYYAHGEDNPNFQRRAYWMLDPAYEHIVLVHYREVTEGNRSCMLRTMHDYGDRSANPANSATLHSQPPPFAHSNVSSLSVMSSMASPETVEMAGTSHSPELEDVDSVDPDVLEEAVSDVVGDHSGLQPSLLEQLSDRHHVPAIHHQVSSEAWHSGFRKTNGGVDGQVNPAFITPQVDFKPSFPNLEHLQQQAPPLSKFRQQGGDINSINRLQDMLDSPGSSYNLPGLSSSSNSLDLTGWSNLLENGRGNGGGNFVKQELSPSPWEAMLNQVTTPISRRNLLQGAGLPPGLGQSPLGREASHPIGAPVSPKGKGIADALSPRNLGREPQSALEADLRDVSEKIVLKEAEEKAQQAQRNRWQISHSDSSLVDVASQNMQAQLGTQQMNVMPFGEPDTLSALVRSGQNQPDSVVSSSTERQWSQQRQQQLGVQNLNQYEQSNQGQQNSLHHDQRLQVSPPAPQQNNFSFMENTGLFSPTIESLVKDIRNEGEDFKKLGSFGKLDSFGRWMNSAADISDIPAMAGNSGSFWYSGDQEDAMSAVPQHMDEGLSPSPSLSEQKFNIMDFSPEWGSSTEDTKVIISGSFVKTLNDTAHKWCCMFGTIEVPAEILGEGSLRCKAPAQEGTVPFYITCGDRQACSQVREFEYRSPVSSSSALMSNSETDTKEELLLKIRLSRMLLGHASLANNGRGGSRTQTFDEKDDNEWRSLESMVDDGVKPLAEVKEQLLQTILNHKLEEWLELKSQMQDGRGPSVLDDRGQGVPHFMGALGYDWSIVPLFTDGIPINFRDDSGCTALHWAARYGREKMVVALLEAGAIPNLISDPTHQYPRGETAADLASAGGHGGIAGFLAEKSLTERLSGLTLTDNDVLNEMDKMSADMEGDMAVAQLSRRTSIVRSVREREDEVRLTVSLEAVRASTHAAALIQSAFRQHSFRRRAQLEEGINDYGLSAPDMHNLLAARKIQQAYRGHQKNKVQNLAAIRIQQKYRGWKGKKDFQTIRQRIIKLQAHVRGRIVRNKYRKILWSVSIVEKVVLRWFRKRKGLRGFHNPSRELQQAVDDNTDLIKEGREMQKEAVQGDVDKVTQMARQKEDRDQYTRLVEEERRTSASKGELNDFLASNRDYMD